MNCFDFVKSSYSSGSGECVEVALNIPETVAVRDSKAPVDGPVLRLAPHAWARFASCLPLMAGAT
ncbi:DUF397 domain-containing protein [Streptomyces olivaceus]|uniref:DUF397 domain-containing protein n=1 Tax=Streptomyces olivaceus TaxID=47716 RepID=UPI001CCE6248|nr:DUF397 domain-containing protein [Streptomyces olivaceus]MBZ6294472.1 DUF397 domain-containing protein [Streptomyces olivaceus]MBZ6329437.1 DUF397 domain-containing protein [Streptomyces olivaceus]